MQILKLLWKELNRPRSIDFCSYETEDEEQERLLQEFAAKKQEIIDENYRKLMQERLIPFCRDLELSTSGMLLSDKQLFERAHARFLQAKADGILDELNRKVEGV